jgi:hypothetical protein
VDPVWPAGETYDQTYQDELENPNRHIAVAYDKYQGSVERFILQLRNREYAVAQMDHNPRSENGHDLREERLHVDYYLEDGSTVHTELPEYPVPNDVGKILRLCVEYLRKHEAHFFRVYYGNAEPTDPPSVQ